MLNALPACSDETSSPSRPTGDRTGTSGGGGTATLVGSWRTTLVIEVPGDLQTWTTTWRFDADGVCRQQQVIESLAEGVPRVTQRSCTYVADGSSITITYLGGGTLTFEYELAGFSPDRLILDGFEYQRLP